MNDPWKDKKFTRLYVKAGEFFNDYLLVVRDKNDSIMVAYSDSSWAIGALQKTTSILDDSWSERTRRRLDE